MDPEISNLWLSEVRRVYLGTKTAISRRLRRLIYPLANYTFPRKGFRNDYIYLDQLRHKVKDG